MEADQKLANKFFKKISEDFNYQIKNDKSVHSKTNNQNDELIQMNSNFDEHLNSSHLNNQIKGDKIVQTTDETKVDLTNLQTNKNKKRNDYLIWEDYFMSIALLSAKRSKDPNTQVGACIVNNENKIVSIGYNGMPNNCNDDLLPWGKSSENALENKYLYVCHAELNSVLNGNKNSLQDCSIYVTLFPCNECAKVIIQSGIKKIYYLDKKKKEKPEYIASKKLLDMANVKLVHYKPKESEIFLKLKVDD